jgi:hypothetical protein
MNKILDKVLEILTKTPIDLIELEKDNAGVSDVVVRSIPLRINCRIEEENALEIYAYTVKVASWTLDDNPKEIQAIAQKVSELLAAKAERKRLETEKEREAAIEKLMSL